MIYHLVWTPKRRKPVLVGKIAHRCEEFLKGKCDEKGWKIIELAIQPDHVHIFVQIWPSDSASEVIKELKGITSFHLRKEFPELRKLPSMWTRSFFAATAGNVSSEIIQKYIEDQKGL
ncbi:MAG: IS200/IS605 family transposase [Candidatus Carbobacillus altaicus]|nr:IS200/IS605 family transposase [Candidatus Carbobacillus altaicus]